MSPVAFVKELVVVVVSAQQGPAGEKRSREEGAPLLQGRQAADPADPAGGTYWNPAIQAWTGRNTRVVASMKESMVLTAPGYPSCRLLSPWLMTSLRVIRAQTMIRRSAER